MVEKNSKPKKAADAGWSDAEKAAMKERAKELKEEKATKSRSADEQVVLGKIAGMAEHDRKIAEKIYQIVKEEFPSLYPKTWYGMPAFQLDGKVLVFFQSAQRFGTRYNTLGFSDSAKLDEGSFWPSSYALVELTAEVEDRIRELIRKAIG